MGQPQGPRTFDPYRILQLQPHASHDLIVESYWTLVGRAKSHGNDAAIRALNAAYELLTNADQRTAYDREHGYLREEPPPDHKKQKERTNGAKAAPDHYRLLAVDPAADVDAPWQHYPYSVPHVLGVQPTGDKDRTLRGDLRRQIPVGTGAGPAGGARVVSIDQNTGWRFRRFIKSPYFGQERGAGNPGLRPERLERGNRNVCQ